MIEMMKSTIKELVKKIINEVFVKKIFQLIIFIFIIVIVTVFQYYIYIFI